jgi:hypothetical protein
MDNVEKRVIKMLRNFDPSLIPFSDEFILENWGNTLYFKRVACRIALDDLQAEVNRFISPVINLIRNKIK